MHHSGIIVPISWRKINKKGANYDKMKHQEYLMLAISRLYSFLDHKNGFNINFLEGQKLIHDLVLLHPMKGQGFSYFRETFLGLLPIIFFLKPGESLGLYIDSEDPYFRLKIETNNAGHTRTLLLPEEFNEFPEKISGQIRITKIFSNNKSPYTSMLELKGVNTDEVIGQDVMVQIIKNAIKMDRIPNAYLLTGIRGVGKTTSNYRRINSLASRRSMARVVRRRVRWEIMLPE